MCIITQSQRKKEGVTHETLLKAKRSEATTTNGRMLDLISSTSLQYSRKRIERKKKTKTLYTSSSLSSPPSPPLYHALFTHPLVEECLLVDDGVGALLGILRPGLFRDYSVMSSCCIAQTIVGVLDAQSSLSSSSSPSSSLSCKSSK
jgi:hypothetical protein